MQAADGRQPFPSPSCTRRRSRGDSGVGFYLGFIGRKKTEGKARSGRMIFLDGCTVPDRTAGSDRPNLAPADRRLVLAIKKCQQGSAFGLVSFFVRLRATSSQVNGFAVEISSGQGEATKNCFFFYRERQVLCQSANSCR